MGIQLDENDWSDCKWWFEDEPGKLRLMDHCEEYIRRIAKEKGLTLRRAIEYVWKEKYEYEK